MDLQTLASAGISSGVIVVLAVLYKIFCWMNGHKIVSDCCGKKTEVGFIVADMTPPKHHVKPHPETKSHLEQKPCEDDSQNTPSAATPKPSITHYQSESA